jgi:glycosyltransferase 2 family protein
LTATFSAGPNGDRPLESRRCSAQAIPELNANTKLRQNLISALKITVSVILVWVIVRHFDLESLRGHVSKLSPPMIALCIGLLAAEMAVLAAVRLRLVLDCLGQKYPLTATSRVAWCGFFFEQVAFGFVGGDAMRLWLLHRKGAALSTSFQALFIDRCMGFGALLLLVFLGLPGLMALVPGVETRNAIAWAYAAIVILGAAGFGVLFLMPARFREHPVVAGILRVVAIGRSEPGRRRKLAVVFLCAALTHLTNILVIYLIGRDLEMPVDLMQWFSIVPAVLLFSMIPITAGGWGLREGILILALQNLGIPPHQGIVPSLVFGFGVMLAALPGGFIWFANRRRMPATAAEEQEAANRS